MARLTPGLFNMLKVGLTGGIGSGKSTIAAIFETLGIPVAYADLEARRLMNEDAGLRRAITEAFGEEAYNNNVLDRKYLAGKVFNDPAKLELLNSLVHPVTIREGERWMQSLSGKHPYAIREAALIFESRTAGNLDFIIGVYAPTPLRVQRAMQRDHATSEDIHRRMRNQFDEDAKMQLCDAVIRNDEQTAVIPQVLALHEELIKKSRSKTGIS